MNDKTAKELRRQAAHASGIALVPLAFVFGKFPAGAASLILAFAIFILAENRGAGKSASGSIHNIFEKFERGGGNYRGAFYFYLASAVSLFLFPLTVAMLSITVLALGDSASTAAGIFGKSTKTEFSGCRKPFGFRAHRIFYNRKKTWEGTLAGFAAAFCGCLLISPQLAFFAAFIGMFVESLPLKIDDNLTIPILTGIALSVIAAL